MNLPQYITSDLLGNAIGEEDDVFHIDIVAGGKILGSYRRIGFEGNVSNYVLIKHDKATLAWNGDKVITIKAVCDNEKEHEISAKNNNAPDFDCPQRFFKVTENIYKSQSDEATECLAVFSNNWIIENGGDIMPLLLCGESFNTCSFVDSLSLKNLEDGTTFTLNSHISDYQVEYTFFKSIWLEKSSATASNRLPEIIVRKKDNGVELSSREYQVVFTNKVNYGNNNSWQSIDRFNRNAPIGIIYLRIIVEDEIVDEKKFLYLKNIYPEFERNSNKGYITWHNLEIAQIFAADTNGVLLENTNMVTFFATRETEADVMPSACNFRIMAPGQNPISIAVSVPFNGLMLLDEEEKLLADDSMLDFDHLYQYRLFAFNAHDVQIRLIYHSEKDSEKHSLKLTYRDFDGYKSLSEFSEIIKRQFLLYENGIFDRGSYVYVKIRERNGQRVTFKVRRHSLDTKKIDGRICVVKLSNARYIDDEPALDINFNGQLLAYPVNIEKENIEPEVIELEKAENNYSFVLPALEYNSDFIVFSSYNDRDKVIPCLYTTENQDFTWKERRENRKNRISILRKSLEESNLDSNS